MRVLFYFLLIFNYSYSQSIEGNILDSKNKQAISFVNIGIKHKNIGVLGNENGLFSIDLKKCDANDTLVFSHISYESKLYLVNEIIGKDEKLNIYLNPKEKYLKEVVVSSRKKIKKIILGNTNNNTHIIYSDFQTIPGGEIGTVLRWKQKTFGTLENVNFNIAFSNLDSMKFRVNVFKFENDKIGASILTEPIYIITTNRRGLISKDIRNLNIHIESDLFLSLEFIEGFRKTKENGVQMVFNSAQVYYCFSPFFRNSFIRKTSQGDWHKINAGIGFNALVIY